MSAAESAEFVDYYELLGVTPAANSAQIRAAYIQRAKQHHPDAGGSEELMQLCNKAYKTLMSASAKAAYDLMHSLHTTAAQGAYTYAEVTSPSGSGGMSDEDIDKFLDTMLAEFRHGVPKPKPGVRSYLKKLFNL